MPRKYRCPECGRLMVKNKCSHAADHFSGKPFVATSISGRPSGRTSAVLARDPLDVNRRV